MPLHSHPHEQLGLVLRGMQALVVDGVAHELGPMEGYVLPGGVEHSAYCGPDGALVLDVFSPVREDYRERWQGRGMRPAIVDGAWDVPERFNFTRDVVEATAAESPDKRALAYVDRINVVRRFTFAEIAILSAHWANLLRDAGIERGDRVLVLVGQAAGLARADAGSAPARRGDDPVLGHAPGEGSRVPRAPLRARACCSPTGRPRPRWRRWWASWSSRRA